MKFRFWVHQILVASFVLTTLVACGGSASTAAPTAGIAAPVATVTPEAPVATATPQPTLEPTVRLLPLISPYLQTSMSCHWCVAKSPNVRS
jgi:hypothetical protein